MCKANTTSLSRKASPRATIARFGNPPPRLKSFSKMPLREPWLFWASFLFRLSVPTMGKPQVSVVGRPDRGQTALGGGRSVEKRIGSRHSRVRQAGERQGEEEGNPARCSPSTAVRRRSRSTRGEQEGNHAR